MHRVNRIFPSAEAARADMRRCANCRNPFSLALDGQDCPTCGCTESDPLYPLAKEQNRETVSHPA